ncbi:hypothetical protein [Halobaculum sp. P14]|uniref:DUF7845 domain-containing protein n=1 Tax=Halobaculum sp. P14 TaxID=3421638 RepID=UPI003EB947A5
MTTRPNPDAPVVSTNPHEVTADLNFATAGSLADNMAPYWALCKFIRKLDGGGTFEARIPWLDGVEPHPISEADPADDDPREEVEVSLYYGTDDDGNPAGKIAPHPDFGLDQDRGMWEPRIHVDGIGERSVGFHVRPRYAEMTHVDTGNRIRSPFDHDHQPDRGFNVHADGSNLEPDEYPHLLRCACQVLAEVAGEDWDEDYFTQPLPTSNISTYERYLRLSRSLSEKLTRMGGAFHQLAMLLSDQEGTEGAYLWDNSEVQGYMHRLFIDQAGANILIPGHNWGTQIKSYHPEHEHSDPDDPLYHPKFGALFQRKVSNHRINDSTVPWSRRHDLGEQLHERLVNLLAWSGIPIDPNAPGTANDEVPAFVEDWHFSPRPTRFDVDLADDPTPQIERSQESMLVRSFQRMTTSDLSLTEQLVADGGRARYDDLAEQSETSETTVYRWLSRMGDAIESQNGVISFNSAHLREQFEEILGRTVTTVENAVDHAVRAADTVLEKDAYQRTAGDPFDNWREKWDAVVENDGHELHLGSCLPHPEEGTHAPVTAGDVTTDGFEAWRKAGKAPGHFPKRVRWNDESGTEHIEDANTLLRHDPSEATEQAIEKLARTFRGQTVVDAIEQVRRMIEAGSSWTPEQIQAAVERAGFDIDVEEHAVKTFEIPG